MYKISLFLVAALVAVSCKKTTPTPTTPVSAVNNNPVTLDSSSASSAYYLSAKIDSKAWGGFESTIKNLQFGYSEIKLLDSQNNILDMKLTTDLMKIDTTSQDFKYIDALEIGVKAINMDSQKFYSDDSLFYAMLKVGNNNFAQGEGNGINVSYTVTADSSEWSTTAGSQAGSFFTITSLKKVNGQTSTSAEIKGTFSCKLYSISNPSATPKIVTNGMFNLSIVK